MNGKRTIGTRYGMLLMLMILLGIGLTGCQGTVFSTKSGVVPKPQRNDLVAGGQHSGLWERHDLAVHYSYERSPKQLKISGQVRFAPYLQKNFPYLVYFHMSMLLLNAEGHVLATKPLATSNYFAGTSHLVTFATTVPLPPGTAAMAFGYTGKARDIDVDQGGGTTSFSYYPTGSLP